MVVESTCFAGLVMIKYNPKPTSIIRPSCKKATYEYRSRTTIPDGLFVNAVSAALTLTYRSHAQDITWLELEYVRDCSRVRAVSKSICKLP